MINLSILIPVYNAEEYITPLLDCILQQADDSTEIILLNDGSQDSSEKICADYEAKHPQKIRLISRENKGAVRTRRELFQASTGEWVWIIDSDDMIPQNAIEVIKKTISENDLCDMILFDYYYDEEKGKVVYQLPYNDGKIFENEEKCLIYKELISGHNLHQLWNKVFKRNLIDFDVDYSEYEDVRKANDCLQVIPIVTNARRIRYTRTPLYIYNTKNQSSLTHAFHDYTYTSLKKVWARKKEFIDKWDMWDELHEDYYLQGTIRAIDLLKKYAWSDKTKQDYYVFFDVLMTDGVFSDAIMNCKFENLKWKDKVFTFVIRKKRAFLSYAILNVWKQAASKKRSIV